LSTADFAHYYQETVRWFTQTTNKSQQQQQSNRNDDDSSKNQDPKDPNDPNNEDKMPLLARLTLVAWLGFIVYVMMRLQAGEEANLYRYVSWNEFVHSMLSKGEVEFILVKPDAETVFIRLAHGAVIKGQRADLDTYAMKIPDIERFEENLRKAEDDLGIKLENRVPVSYERSDSWMPVIFLVIASALIFMVFKNVVKIQLPNPTDMFASERKAKFIRVDLMTQQGKGVTFSDVAGLHEAKVEVMEFVDYLKRPGNYQQLGAKIPKGALLLGPPGCGKTLLAKAVATESKVPFLAMAGSDFVEMLGGLGAARVRDLFKEARQRAPCIIYIDEIDAIGRKRSGNNWADNSEEEHTLNQMLVEMDGIGTKEGVIVLASTNRPDVLDQALMRPGRFDRHILIDLPNLAERKEIFETYLKKLKLARPATEYSANLAHLSPGMSGADIANICNEAALHAARDKCTTVDTSDFEYAVLRVTAGVSKKSRILSPQEKKVVAYHEAGHALVGWLLKHTDTLMMVSIVPRTNRMLGFAQYMPQDKKLRAQDAIFEQMCMMLGGRVAESLIFNSVTSGAQDDLTKVTNTAYDQIRLMGMNEKVGMVSFPRAEADKFIGQPYSQLTQQLIDNEAQSLITSAYRHTEDLLKENIEKLRIVAEALLEKETLTYKDMEQLVGPPPFGLKSFITDWKTFSPPPTKPTPPPTSPPPTSPPFSPPKGPKPVPT